MEMKIKSPSADKPLAPVEFNFDELKKAIAVELKKYKNLTYSDDTIGDAKKDKAKLNSFIKAIEAKRIEIKKQCMQPYMDFEAKVKELVGMVQEPLAAIADQTTAYEDRRKAEKRQAIEDFWDAHESSFKPMVVLDSVFNPRWLNATFTMAAVEDEINTFLSEAEAGYSTIKDLGTEFEEQVIRVYLREFNLPTALAENTRLQEQKAKREEFERQQQAKAEQSKPAPEPKPEPKAPTSVPQAEAEELEEIDFRVWVTSDQKAALRAFMIENGIKYGNVNAQQAA